MPQSKKHQQPVSDYTNHEDDEIARIQREKRERETNSRDPFNDSMDAMRRAMANSSGMKIGEKVEGTLDKGMSGPGGKKEKEELIYGSLNERAQNLLKTKDYKDKIR